MTMTSALPEFRAGAVLLSVATAAAVSVRAPAQAESFAELALPVASQACLEMAGFTGQLIFTTYPEVPPGLGSMTLWRSDGTKSGTLVLRRFENARISCLTTSERAVYFFVDFGRKLKGVELWRTDGTQSRTRRVAVLPLRHSLDTIDHMVSVGGKVYFVGWDPTHGYEVWVSDDTNLRTGMLKDLKPNVPRFLLARPKGLVAFRGRVYFTVPSRAKGMNDHCTLYSTDGVAAQQVKLFYHAVMWVSHDRLFIRGAPAAKRDPLFGKVGLYVLQDQPVGVRGNPELNQLRAFAGERYGELFQAQDFAWAGGRIFFTAEDELHGRELHVSEGAGSTSVTRLVKDIAPGPRNGHLGGNILASHGGYIYFNAVGRLWRSAGTEESTTVVTPNGATFCAQIGHDLYFDGLLKKDLPLEVYLVNRVGTGGTQPVPGSPAMRRPIKALAVGNTLYLRFKDSYGEYRLYGMDAGGEKR